MQNRSNYDYYFIIKELEENFIKQFACLGKITGKYIILKVALEKEVTRTDKNGGEITKNHILHITIYWKPKICGRLIIKSCQ